jgi:hypothetical protein
MRTTKLLLTLAFFSVFGLSQCAVLVLNPITMQLDCVANAMATATVISTGTTSNTDLAGTLTTTSGTVSYTFSSTNASAPICVADNYTDANTNWQITVTTTTLTITHGGTTPHVFSYICIRRT